MCDYARYASTITAYSKLYIFLVHDCATSMETMRASSWAERNRRSWRGDLRAIGPADLVPGTENDNKSAGGDETFRTRRSFAVSRMTKTWTVSGIPGLLVLVPVTVCATITYVNQDSSRCNDRSNSKISISSQQNRWMRPGRHWGVPKTLQETSEGCLKIGKFIRKDKNEIILHRERNTWTFTCGI